MAVKVIFGGTGGIGRALAQELIKGGHEVCLVARGEERLAETAAELKATYRICDARSFADVDRVLSELGEIDGVANCIGSLLLKPAHLTSEQELQDTFEANLKTAFAIVRGTARKIPQGGSILLFSSAAARIGLANHEAIAACKAAVQGLALAAAASYASRGLRVNAIAPGLVETPLTAKLTSRPLGRQASEAQHPLGRLGQPEDIAPLAAWLLGAESGWITGQIFGVDGGLATVKLPQAVKSVPA